jgi:hypothetical protein
MMLGLIYSPTNKYKITASTRLKHSESAINLGAPLFDQNVRI